MLGIRMILPLINKQITDLMIRVFLSMILTRPQEAVRVHANEYEIIRCVLSADYIFIVLLEARDFVSTSQSQLIACKHRCVYSVSLEVAVECTTKRFIPTVSMSLQIIAILMHSSKCVYRRYRNTHGVRNESIQCGYSHICFG